MTGSGVLIPRERNPLLLVLSGPSGSGKDSLIECLGRRGLDIFRVVTVTTRPPRPGEIPGRDYVFVSTEEFERLRAGGQLLEYAQVYGHWYGTPKEPVRQALARGQDVLLRVDVQGARAVRQLCPGAVLIFLTPPTEEELVRRLKARRTESPAEVARRLQKVREELAALPMFDYVIINYPDRLEEAAAQFEAIVTAEHLRVNPRRVCLD